LNIRTQLSLYVPPAVSASLEAARRLLDPIQARLIPVHVTLCREDKLSNLEFAAVRSRLAAAEAAPVTLKFGNAELFQEHGVLLPCVDGESEFQALRQWALGTDAISHQAPHITLAHPRNPKSPNNNALNVATLPSNLTITFASACVIQQEDAQPWQVLEQYFLSGRCGNHA
jgi:2'-5' RNA ligase